MYEDRTYDNIMSEMMNSFGANVRTDEGSLAFNACAKQAAKLEDAYEDLAEVRDNLTIDTMDLDHLISYSAQAGISYKYATAPIVRGVFQQEIEEGTQFSCGDYTYTSGALIGDAEFNYYLTCDQEGTEANANLGELEPVEYVDDWLGGEITEVLTYGTDDEDTEEFRARIQASFGAKSFGGNKADYRNYVDSIEGVGGCKPMRREEGSPWIKIYVITDRYLVPTAELITTVQELVDPEETSGEGDGMAPMCHHVKILPVESQTLAISATITLDGTQTIDTVTTRVRSALEKYFAQLRESWESQNKSALVVRLAQIDARILTVEGVIDVTDTMINGVEENAELAFYEIPLLGEVTLNV